MLPKQPEVPKDSRGHLVCTSVLVSTLAILDVSQMGEDSAFLGFRMFKKLLTFDRRADDTTNQCSGDV